MRISWNLQLLALLLLVGCPSSGLERRSVGALAAQQEPELEVIFLEVGQGDSTLIKCPGGRRILIDCGSTSTPAMSRTEVANELKGHLASPPVIDVLVVTHPDADHYNMLKDVLGGITVKKIMLPGSAEDQEGRDELINQYQSSDFDDWLRSRKADIRWIDVDNEVKTSRAASNMFFSSDDGVKFYILASNVGGDDVAKNDRSIVLKVTFKEFDLVLTGDATKVTENYILAKYLPPDDATPDWLDIDFLKLGHHGSRATSSQATWLNRLLPEFAMASAGSDNDYGHPSKDVITRIRPYLSDWQAHKIMQSEGKDKPVLEVAGYTKALWVTCANGTIILKSKGLDKTVDVSVERN